MRFSDYFKIRKTKADDWFDPILNTDTRLFVDPFRIAVDSDQAWQRQHAHLTQFFDNVLYEVDNQHQAVARKMLRFPEPPEFCLGYAIAPSMGVGTGPMHESAMLQGAAACINNNIKSLRHFEELTLYADGIGPDRISDMTCDVLKEEFIDYTWNVVRRHKVPMKRVRVRHAHFNHLTKTWEGKEFELPENPYNGKGILLVPQRFLRGAPSVDHWDFWEWAWANRSGKIRGDFDPGTIDAKTLPIFARKNPDLVKDYLAYLERNPKQAYDLAQDPDLKVRWYEEGRRFAERIPLVKLPTTRLGFGPFLEEIVSAFVYNVEQEDGWRLFWSGDRSRPGRSARALFRSMFEHYCRRYNIELPKRSTAGRGTLEMLFPTGWKAGALIDVKLTNNGRYWSSLQEKLPDYMLSRGISCGYLVHVGLRDADFVQDRLRRARQAADRVASRLGVAVTAVSVDARRRGLKVQA